MRWPNVLMVAFIAGALGVTGGVAWERARVAQDVKAATPPPEPEHRLLVQSKMNDPDSARFRADRQGLTSADIRCGEVNGRNRMGGMVGFRRYITNLRTREVVFDNDEPVSETDRYAHNAFKAQWETDCAGAPLVGEPKALLFVRTKYYGKLDVDFSELRESQREKGAFCGRIALRDYPGAPVRFFSRESKQVIVHEDPEPKTNEARVAAEAFKAGWKELCG